MTTSITSRAEPRVFNIPASAPFLKVLVRALLDGELIAGLYANSDPLAFAQATLYLPTRRACRLAREVFLAETKGDAAILPRIVAIGDIDDDELIFASSGGVLSAEALDIPPALDPLERQLALARLILEWSKQPRLRGAEGTPLVAGTPASALALANDLARLMDDMTTRKVSWDRLDGLVPDALDPYWQYSLEFLKIARTTWPAFLNEQGTIEPAERRDKLIEAEAARITCAGAPVIAAGSTGSIPATALLLETIARLPHGAVVLPGLDEVLDEASWRNIGGNKSAKPHDGGMPVAGHPQFAMQALLARIGVTRERVRLLAENSARECFVSEALRPAATTELWRGWLDEKAFTPIADRAMEHITVIEAATVEDEALAIAVALRETLETPGQTAALVTPDRALARRVLAALVRWGIDADDSGGDTLSDTPAGVFARLAAEAALGGLEPVPLLALLKHPLLRLGRGADEWRAAISALERALLRGPRPKAGSAALVHALSVFRAEMTKAKSNQPSIFHRSDPRLKMTDADLDAAESLLGGLAAALAPLETRTAAPQPLSEFARLHRDVVTALSTGPDGQMAAFAGDDGRTLERALQDVIGTRAAAGFAVAAADYPDAFRDLMTAYTVRRPEKPGVRIRIYGPLESRLQTADRVVLGGLNEGVWPPDMRSDPWLSRPMRQSLGLDLPERRIGLAAHDFAQSLGAPEVILTRAAKVGGAPTVTSRFVQRLAALAGETRWKAALQCGQKYIDWAHDLDKPIEVKPAARPAPKPPLVMRPQQLSVTDIENWLRDPYTIYAKHILKLIPYDAIDTPPGAADRGTIIHGAIGEFTQVFAAKLPADPLKQLLALGEKHFAPLADYPEARAFWWPRFQRIAQWFVAWEQERRSGLNAVYGEISGRMDIPAKGGAFTLTARADRIEKRKDGGYVIIDYKTGRPRSNREVRAGLAPQLTLEAAILNHGGFKPVPAGTVDSLQYITLKGGDRAGEEHPITFKDSSADTQADYALKRLTGVIEKFQHTSQGYDSLVSPQWSTHYGDYDHLARVKEWSSGGGDGEDSE